MFQAEICDYCSKQKNLIFHSFYWYGEYTYAWLCFDCYFKPRIEQLLKIKWDVEFD